MSFVHHDPPASAPCVGCGEPIAPGDLVRDEGHVGRSCCWWHPFHAGCLRRDAVPAGAWTSCAGCGAPLDGSIVEAAARWLEQRLVHDPHGHHGWAPRLDVVWRRVLVAGAHPRSRGEILRRVVEPIHAECRGRTRPR